MSASRTPRAAPTPSPKIKNTHAFSLVSRVACDLASLGSAAYILAYLWIAVSRLATPFEIEWMEGGMIAHALRLREGLPIYAPPSLDFVPFFYTPGYPAFIYALGALTEDITGGISFALARGVSFAASLGVMFGIYKQIRAETQSWRYGLLGAGLFAALFRTCGAFYDLARPDSLMLLLALGALLAGRRACSWRGALLSALLISSAFFTKQTAAVFAPVIAGWLFWEWRRVGRYTGLIFVGCTLGLCSLGTLSLNAHTEGAFWSYIFEGHQGHVFHWKNIRLRYWRDLIFLAPLTLFLPLLWLNLWRHIKIIKICVSVLALHWLIAFGQRIITLDYPPHMYYRELWYEDPRWLIVIPPLFLVSLIALSGLGYIGGQERSKRALETTSNMSPYWLWVFISGAGASGLNHSTQWAYSNCFMLIALGFALAAPMMIRDLSLRLEEHPRDNARSQARVLALWGLIIIQMIAWVYRPSAQVPQAHDIRAWGALKERLMSYPTPLLTPAHPTYNALEREMRGAHAVHTHQMGIRDVAYRGGVRGLTQRLDTQRARAHGEEPAWSAVMLHEHESLPYLERFYYQAERWRYLSPQSLRTKTGHLTRPSSLWLPRRAQVAHRVLERSSDGDARQIVTPLSLNFEHPQALWAKLGWHRRGDAFGLHPSCPPRWRGEGRCGARSDAHTQRQDRYDASGTLSAEITLPAYGYLSALARGETRTRSRGDSSRAVLELRLEVLTRPRVPATRIRIHTDGRWRRYILAPKLHQAHAINTPVIVRVSLIDTGPDVALSVDDLRVGIALDAPR